MYKLQHRQVISHIKARHFTMNTLHISKRKIMPFIRQKETIYF